MPHVRPATREEAAAVLSADPVRNFSALRVLTQWEIPTDLHVCGGSAFFRFPDPNGGAFVVLCAASEEEGTALAALAEPGDNAFFTMDHAEGEGSAPNRPAALLIGTQETRWHNPCVQMSLPADAVLPPSDPDVRPLDPGMARYSHERYTMRHILGPDYIEERIRNGPSAGLVVDGTLVGFSMTHDEGTMGVLEVLPEWRRKGVAERVSWALCRWVREAGMIPTVHIKRGNAASMALAAKMGFVRTGDCTWFGWAAR